MGDEEVAVLLPSHLTRVRVFDDETKHVLVVPLVNQSPYVAPVKVFGPVEQRSRGLHRDRRDLVFGFEMRNDISQRPVESALPVKRAFQLEVGAVPFVGVLFCQGKCQFAAHGMVSAGIEKEAADLFHGKVPLLAHVTSTRRTVGEPGEAVGADQVTFDALSDGRGDVVQADGTFQQREYVVGLHGAQLNVRVHG